MSGGQGSPECSCVHPLRFELHYDSHSHDVATGERPMPGLEDPEVLELSDVFDARPRTLCQLVFGDRVALRSRNASGDVRDGVRHKRILAGFRTEVVRIPFVLGSHRRVVGIDPHPADGIGDYRHDSPSVSLSQSNSSQKAPRSAGSSTENGLISRIGC